ncbi:MAG: hypothetical protein IKQ27_13965, partial [Lachnospiraceae bacterium]|nr:hypothetical protein [Lachnospiraceae bacterium]
MCSILGFCGKDTEGKIIKDALEKTHSRGPDDYRVMETGNGFLAFNRLAIMGLTENGMQPFAYGGKKTLKYSKQMYADSKITTKPEGSEILLVCNGEIYGFRKSKEELLAKGYEFISDSDCEILPALYKEYGTDMFAKL